MQELFTYDIEPQMDGSWNLYRWPSRLVLGNFKTVEAAKKAADNLERKTIRYKSSEVK